MAGYCTPWLLAVAMDNKLSAVALAFFKLHE
jgi:hypothetical protein